MLSDHDSMKCKLKLNGMTLSCISCLFQTHLPKSRISKSAMIGEFLESDIPDKKTLRLPYFSICSPSSKGQDETSVDIPGFLGSLLGGSFCDTVGK